MTTPIHPTAHTLSLAGEWRLARASEDVFPRDGEWKESAILPGSLAVQRIGEPVTLETKWTGTIFDRGFFDGPEFAEWRREGAIALPFWLQPERVHVGPAWYARDIEIPEAWANKHVILFLERPHGWTRVWLDGREVGQGESLSTPHVFDLGEAHPGRHQLVLEVDNRLRVELGENAHSVSDHTQGNWNGVIGRVELRATERVWIDDLQVYPNITTHTIAVTGKVSGATEPMRVTLEPGRAGRGVVEVMTEADGRFAATLELSETAARWDEFSPRMHRLIARLENGETREVHFGLREVGVNEGRICVNGRPVFLRGALDCCVFPLTGYPPMDVEPWRRILGTIRDHGLNHVRFHSWCPPEAAFVAADELGLYLQVEAPTWPNSVAVLAFNSPAGIGDGNAVDAWTLRESERIVRAYGNHPSFMMMAAGNEPGGPHHREYLSAWVMRMRDVDTRHLYTGTAGWPELPENDFHVISEPRGHQWGDGLASRMNAQPPATTADYRDIVAKRNAPVIAHEIGQWCAYPRIHDKGKYRGHLQPRIFEIVEASARRNGLDDRLRDFIAASEKLQAICYKEEIESALRTPRMAGFQLLGLQDFPGQGTAPVGVLDHFWESKGAVSATMHRRYCGATVPLARLERRLLTTADSLRAEIEVAHYGADTLLARDVSWRLLDDRGNVFLSGKLLPRPIPTGTTTALGLIDIALKHLPSPARYRLEVSVDTHANDWSIWVYPEIGYEESEAVLVTSDADVALAAAERGDTVLWWVPKERAAGDVALGFTPIFWNTWCTKRQAPHTLGIWCDPAHPALAEFPTEAHSDWQWWPVIARGGALVLDRLPPVEPIVAVIDDWWTNRRLALAFEASVGKGRLLVCGVDLSVHDPVVKQLRRSLIHYLDTAPARSLATMDVAALRQLTKS